MSPVPAYRQLDLHRLSDLGLEPDDIHALLITLEADLKVQIPVLSRSLENGVESDAMHRQLHAIKGMAGMLSREALHQAVAQADDAWRHSRPDTGRTLTQALLPLLHEWLAEVRDCLQRYSSG